MYKKTAVVKAGLCICRSHIQYMEVCSMQGVCCAAPRALSYLWDQLLLDRLEKLLPLTCGEALVLLHEFCEVQQVLPQSRAAAVGGGGSISDCKLTLHLLQCPCSKLREGRMATLHHQTQAVHTTSTNIIIICSTSTAVIENGQLLGAMVQV